jgi:nucleoside-diphosphate-sugar epimerase
LPIDPNARLDIVDAGFVAEATLRLLESPNRTHRCYHLSAGTEGCVTVGRLAEVVGQVYGRRTTLELIPPAEWAHNAQRVFIRSAIQRRVFRSLRHYLPFLNMDVVFDNARLAAAMSLTPLNPRPIVQYLPALLRLIRPKAALKEAALP